MSRNGFILCENSASLWLSGEERGDHSPQRSGVAELTAEVD
jgi:hypothetical protein